MQRNCLGCPAVDDHPRHVVAVSPTEDVYWHQDCHAKAGCSSCQWLVQHKGELVGDEWRQRIGEVHAELTPEQIEQAPAQRDAVTQFVEG